jgi:hypothetical protein
VTGGVFSAPPDFARDLGAGGGIWPGEQVRLVEGNPEISFLARGAARNLSCAPRTGGNTEISKFSHRHGLRSSKRTKSGCFFRVELMHLSEGSTGI